jgi:hypothetical protein
LAGQSGGAGFAAVRFGFRFSGVQSRANMNVAALCDESAGEVVERYAYDP